MDRSDLCSVAGRPAVFISYPWDVDGRRIADFLVHELDRHGCDVSSDHDLPLKNPASIPAWMDTQISTRTVICVLTPSYVEAFEDSADSRESRRGVRYELRAIRQRIYDHQGPFGCPVIPVTGLDFDLDSVPTTLKTLDICRLDFQSGAGFAQLVTRIIALSGGLPASIGPPPTIPTQRSTSAFRRVALSLESELPPAQAISLIDEGLKLADEPASANDLLAAFPRLGEVIQDVGQVDLMRRLATVCLRELDLREPLLRAERVVRAQVMICARAWHLQRDHQLPEALDEAQRGIQLARRHDALRVAGHGWQSVGRIYRLLAEEAPLHRRDHLLTVSTDALNEAIEIFNTVETKGVRRSQVGATFSLLARTMLSRCRLLGETSALRQADELARRAATLLTSDQRKDVLDLQILRAEIAAAHRRYSDSRVLLGSVIESLIADQGTRRSEILARAYVARATATGMSPRASRGREDALTDLARALEIFRTQQLDHAAACCEWRMLTTDPRSMTTAKVSLGDIAQLEELVIDPRIRLAAVEVYARQADASGGARRVGPADWLAIIRQVRRYE